MFLSSLNEDEVVALGDWLIFGVSIYLSIGGERTYRRFGDGRYLVFFFRVVAGAKTTATNDVPPYVGIFFTHFARRRW